MFKKKWLCCWVSGSRGRRRRESSHRNAETRYRSESSLRGIRFTPALRSTGRRVRSFLRRLLPCGMSRGRLFRRRGKPFWPAFMRKGFRTVRRPRFTRRCSTKGIIIARFARCTGFWKARARCVSAVTSLFILLTRSRNCRLQVLVSSGVGTSQSCWAGKVDILLPLRDSRCIQQICGGLDGC